MRNLFVLLLIMMSLATQAQKIRYTDKRNHWISKGSWGMPGDYCTWTHYISFGSDTTFNGLTYQRLIVLRVDDFWGTSCGGHWVDSTDLYVREDTAAGYVYGHSAFINTGWNYDTVEHILYNYNLHVGDTVNNFYYSLRQTDSVISVDSTLINGAYHKVFGFQTIRSNNSEIYPGYGYIEGFGSGALPYYPFSAQCFEGSEQVVCFYQDSTYVPVHTAFFGCMFPDSINTGIGCKSVFVDNVLKNTPSVFITPNPTTTEIKISIQNSSYKNVSLSIYDMQGRAVYNSTNIKEETTINCSSWPEGTYLAVVQTENGILKKEKIVVVH